ncbi:MAG: NAD-glutamate dehydrogenase [Acidobacteria bacterium]|nr:NAD-glutamate dehydrogenase [Acidobacteriota bacterium]
MIADEARKAEIVDDIVDKALRSVEGDQYGLERFIRKFYELVSPADIIPRSLDNLLSAVLSLWEFGEKREPDTPKLRFKNPSEEGGWAHDRTVLEIVNDDMPFLVDSITAAIVSSEHTLQLVIHPVVEIRRTPEGVRSADGEPISESYMQLELNRETSPDVLESMRASILDVLADVRVAVRDWKAMREQMRESLRELSERHPPVAEEEVDEAVEFLKWLDDEHFTFLGYRRYDFVTEKGDDYLKLDPESGLGILREVRPESAERGAQPFTEEFSQFARRNEMIIVAKANSRSRVHRPVHMDRISVKRFAEDGRVIGEHRFLGLFTSTAYSRSVKFIPLLRRKASRTLERAELAPNSHAGKALAQILETLPRDELFQITEDELYEMSLGILQLQERQRTALFVRRDVFERFLSCLVFVPRDHYDSNLREKIRVILEVAFNGVVTAFYTQMTDSPLARAHFIVKTEPGKIPEYDLKAVETLIAEAARSWNDHLRAVLIEKLGEEEGREQFSRFREAFPVAYKEKFTAADAVRDIQSIDALIERGDLIVELYEQPSEESGELLDLHCKFINLGDPLALSDIVPRLENMGLRVEMATPHELHVAGEERTVRIRDFTLIMPMADIEIAPVKEPFQEAFIRAWKGDTEDDGFNRLVLCAGLEWYEIIILRAYCKYLRQLGVTFSETYMQVTLANNPTIAYLLVRLFNAMFDPEASEEERDRVDEIRDQIEGHLDGVSNVDEDRILRHYLEVIDATLRTNFFQPLENGERKRYLSMKFDSRSVSFMPAPKPMFEIFVYSPRFEGVHLRGGRVARGGLRWSDRREDFRQEILGLVKAQIVKNAVIVPVGSKGGFVLKQAPPASDRDAFLEEGIHCYQNFLRGLLDLTDNLVGDVLVPPKNVVRRDPDDSYLVVAADKGTATFSDYANAVAAEYDFWLGDAFASGGSAGYDHKKMGITARGAWEAVKRHFRELGHDTQAADFTVVGVGDMAGDVFGNGMLLSQHIRLVGAFNHMHIFVDPDPDPATSFNERKRLFDTPRTTWADYDRSVMSEGGSVFDRSSKTIRVSPQIRELYGLESETTTPNDLIKAMLRARVDLLWLGGIGTYVKSSEQTHAEAHDRANDALRVNADELRTRVVGEGANLGFTQEARIEFARRGGKINTDAIDNSAGVDTSDHEVNIKIALDTRVRQGALDQTQRNELLADMTNEVAELVLRDNYQQTQAISVIERLAPEILDQHARLMKLLERKGRLDRALEFLPNDEEITERATAGQGLTRPEIAVLLAYAKIDTYEELLESNLPDDPLLVKDLLLYFPMELRERYREAIEQHRLRREIIATHVTNSMVNRVGATFVSQMIEETGRTVSDIARAYTIARDAFAMRKTWAKIEGLDNKVASGMQTDMFIAMQGLLERTTRWLLRTVEDLDITRNQQNFNERIMTLAKSLDDTLSDERLLSLREEARDHEMLGIPKSLANRLASLDIVGSFPDIVRIAMRTDRDVREAGKVYFDLGARLGFDALREAASGIAAESAWQRAALAGLIDDLFGYQSDIASDILASSPNGEVEVAIAEWLAERGPVVERTERVLTELRSASAMDLSMLAVAARTLRRIAQA